MAEKELKFICAYANCGKENTVIVKVAKALPTQSKGVTRGYYCEYCNQKNRIAIPDNVDVHVFILGRDEGFLGYTNAGIVRLQGEKDE